MADDPATAIVERFNAGKRRRSGRLGAAERGLRGLVKELALRTGIYRETFFNVYPLVHEPHQLIFLAQRLEELRDVPGTIVEAGCSRGATTVWLKKHMDHLGLKRPVYALDTFEGFVPEQAEYELRHRGKDRSLRWVFAENRLRWFEETLRVGGVSGVTPIRCDVARFDFATVAPIAFCFLDVDLYLPIRAALPGIYAALSPGGLIVVDDCLAGTPYDGALAAYQEFAAAEGLPATIVHTKYGLVRRRSQASSDGHDVQAWMAPVSQG